MARRRDYWRGGGDDYGFGRYVTVAEKRANASAEVARRRKKGAKLSPVVIEGRAIAKTFWGKAWCRHLEDHCDYDNRLPRGRTYARNGSVIDLQIGQGEVRGLVCGKSTYKVRVDIAALDGERWQHLCKDSAGRIDSLVALLQGKLDAAVLERLCDPSDGMFPQHRQLDLSCSCPDWARMCKHVAAVLYGVGARLDLEPELLFVLRGVDQTDLMGAAVTAPMATDKGDDALAGNDLGALFGVEMDGGFELPVDVSVDVPVDVPVDAPSAAPAAVAKPISEPPRPAATRTKRGDAMVITRAKTKKSVKSSRKRPARPRTGPRRGPRQSASKFALATLARFANEEMLVEGLWQLGEQAHTRPALRQALKRLHDKGLVSRYRDDSRDVWWQITDIGGAALPAP